MTDGKTYPAPRPGLVEAAERDYADIAHHLDILIADTGAVPRWAPQPVEPVYAHLRHHTSGRPFPPRRAHGLGRAQAAGPGWRSPSIAGLSHHMTQAVRLPIRRFPAGRCHGMNRRRRHVGIHRRPPKQERFPVSTLLNVRTRSFQEPVRVRSESRRKTMCCTKYRKQRSPIWRPLSNGECQPI
jgi:hypothetical protein